MVTYLSDQARYGVDGSGHRAGSSCGYQDPEEGTVFPSETEQFLREARAAAQLRGALTQPDISD